MTLKGYNRDELLSHTAGVNKYVGPPYRRAEMYAGRVARGRLLSHGEYADGTDRQTDARSPDRCKVADIPSKHFQVVREGLAANNF